MYIGFIDFKEDFDSIRRDRLWNILKHYGIPDNFVNIIRELYDGSTCCVVERGQTSGWFPVESGVKQGCVMSGFLFNIIIDWIMKNTNNARRGLRWKFTTVLEDLDYADDIALLSSRHKISKRSVIASIKSQGIPVFASTPPRKGATNKHEGCQPNFSSTDKTMTEVSSFIYLGATVQGKGGSHEDIKQSLLIARRAFGTLNPVWRSKMYSKHSKLKILKSCVTSVFLFGDEMCRNTSTDIDQLDVFHRKCLRRILGIFWLLSISYCDLYERLKQRPISETVKVRRWRWIGHILRREKDNNCRVALTWTPEGKRK